MRSRAMIFAVALLVRGVIAWIFFGSVDVTNSLLNAARMFSGWSATQVPVPYLPGLQLLFWTGGVLATYTSLPLTFCFKLFPAIFDSVLAVMVHDSQAAGGRRAVRSGLLYAFAPIPLIITAIHGQWDSISFVFLVAALLLVGKRTRTSSALAGFCWMLSVIVKPITVPFFPLLFPAPWTMVRGDDARERRAHAWAVMTGVMVCLGGYAVALGLLGDVVTPHKLRAIAAYATQSIHVAGLPSLLGLQDNRLISLAPLLALIPMYWKGWVTREKVVLLTFALLLGTSAISTQYLIWIVPFLLMSGHLRFAAIYNLLAGLFLVIHYHHPGPTATNFHNLGAFGPLLELTWLAPAATFLREKTFLYLFLGSFAVPISCLLFAAREIVRTLRARIPVQETPAPLSVRQLLAPVVLAMLFVAGVVGYAASKPEPTVAQFTSAVREKVRDYAVMRYRGPGLFEPTEPTWVIPAYAENATPPASRAVDAVSIGYAWVFLWSLAAWFGAGERRRLPAVASASFVAVAALLACHAVGVLEQMARSPHVDEAEYLHAGWLMHGGLRLYRDFFEHHAPFLFQLLAELVPSGGSPEFPLLDVMLFTTRARAVVGFMGTLAVLAAAWLSYRISRWPVAPALVLAALFTPAAVWYRGLTDIRNDAPSLMLFWIGALLLISRWRTPEGSAVGSGVGIGMAFASALWNPKWPFACFFLGGVYLVRLWQSRKNGVRTVLLGIVPAVALVLVTLGVLLQASTLSDYISFTFDYTMRLGEWWKVNEHMHAAFPRPWGFCPRLFKGAYAIAGLGAAVAFLAIPRLRTRLDKTQRWQLGAVLGLSLIAALELRFIAPYPNLWPQYFMMWCFSMAILYAVVGGALIELMPEPTRLPIAVVTLVTAFALFITTFERRMLPVNPAYSSYWTAVSHVQRNLQPADTVWLGVLVHPIAARDAHYYWFGFAEHIAYMLEAQARGDAPAYLPAVAELELPPCRAARGADRSVRFVMAGTDIEVLKQTTACVESMLSSGRARLIFPMRNVAEIRR